MCVCSDVNKGAAKTCLSGTHRKTVVFVWHHYGEMKHASVFTTHEWNIKGSTLIAPRIPLLIVTSLAHMSCVWQWQLLSAYRVCAMGISTYRLCIFQIAPGFGSKKTFGSFPCIKYSTSIHHDTKLLVRNTQIINFESNMTFISAINSNPFRTSLFWTVNEFHLTNVQQQQNLLWGTIFTGSIQHIRISIF